MIRKHKEENIYIKAIIFIVPTMAIMIYLSIAAGITTRKYI